MDEIEVEAITDCPLEDPILIEGLPGVGHVGKLAADHLVDEFNGELIRRVYSEYLPPQVSVDEDGVATLACVELYGVTTDVRDLLLLVGDYQAQDIAGHYRLAETFLDIATALDSRELITLGGVPTGEIVEDYSVIGAVSDKSLRTQYENANVEFRENEPAGGIIGTSGLLLGLGGKRGLPAVCLMGETSGYIVDPQSAQAVLKVLEEVIGFDIDVSKLEARADELKDVIQELQDMQQGPSQATAQTDEDLRYFG